MERILGNMRLESQSVANSLGLLCRYELNETVFQTYSVTDYADRTYFYRQGRTREQYPLS